MLIVRTYLKRNKEFILIENFNYSIDDALYIEGALELIINDIKLINIEMWDYIDELWAYIIEGLVCINQNKEFTCYFPDQPIKLSFLPIKNKEIIVSVISNKKENKVIINKEKFLIIMQKSAKHFLKYLVQIVPEEQESANILLNDLNLLVVPLRPR